MYQKYDGSALHQKLFVVNDLGALIPFEDVWLVEAFPADFECERPGVHTDVLDGVDLDWDAFKPPSFPAINGSLPLGVVCHFVFLA